MRVLFIQNDPFIVLGTTQLTGWLRSRGHEVDVLVTPIDHDLEAAVRRDHPDIIAIYCVFDMHRWLIATVRQLKKSFDIPVIIGGPHPTFHPAMIREAPIDFLCRGEGELPFAEVLEAIGGTPGRDPRHIDNVWFKENGSVFENEIRPCFENLDDFPIPDAGPYSRYRRVLEFHRDRFPIVSTRGCPYSCSFCFAGPYRELYRDRGHYLRRRSPEHVVAEARDVISRFVVRRFVFEDDTFVVSLDWLRRFTSLWKTEINRPYICQTVGWSINEESAELLKESGCMCVRVGLEVGDEESRTDLLNKELTDEQLHLCAKLLHQHRIKLQTFNVFGIPGMDLEKNLKTYRLNRELKTDFTWCSVLQPYPGTEITRKIMQDQNMQEGLSISPGSRDWNSMFKSSTLNLQQKNQIVNLQKLTLIALWLHVPEWLLRLLIKVPENRLYHFAFSAVHYYFIKKTHRIRLLPAIRIAMLYRGYYD